MDPLGSLRFESKRRLRPTSCRLVRIAIFLLERTNCVVLHKRVARFFGVLICVPKARRRILLPPCPCELVHLFRSGDIWPNGWCTYIYYYRMSVKNLSGYMLHRLSAAAVLCTTYELHVLVARQASSLSGLILASRMCQCLFINFIFKKIS